MDPVLCCLLGLCCPPLMRRKKITNYIMSFGMAPDASEKLADDLIAKTDALMNTTIGGLFKQIILASMTHSDDETQ
jgi:hypothetical protein